MWKMAAIGKGRLEYVDVAKGLAIIGVYFGHHAVLPNCMTNWFWAFHMPLFFIIAGMYSKRLTEQNIKKVFYSGFRNLVVPYFLTELVLTVCLLVMTHQSAILLHPIAFAKCLSLHLFVESGPIWFLLALFYGRCFVSLFYTPPHTLAFLRCSRRIVSFFIVVLFFVGWKCGCLLKENGIADYASLMKGFLSVIYIYVGILLRRCDLENISLNECCTAFAVVTFAGQVSFNMYYFEYPIGIFNVFTSSLACLSFLVLLKSLETRKSVIVEKIFVIFSFIGRNTLFILCAHTLELVLKVSRFIPIDNMAARHVAVFIVIIISIPMFKRIPVVSNIYKIQ